MTPFDLLRITVHGLCFTVHRSQLDLIRNGLIFNEKFFGWLRASSSWETGGWYLWTADG